MIHRLITRILIVVLLAATLFPARQAGAWYCEGQRCGITLWGCCCVAPEPYQDGKCNTPDSRGSGKTTTLCATSCSCVLVITNTPDTDRTTPPSTVAPVVPLLAVLPTPVFFHLSPVLLEATAYSVDTRGPPPVSVVLVSPSLRAPPAA